MQLKVDKLDGSSEVYLHTKVMGTLAAALSECGCYEQNVAEQLAEAVTTFLCRRYESRSVSSDEIFAMIQAVLSETHNEEAALQLHDHRVNRQLERNRTEVLHWHGTVGAETGEVNELRGDGEATVPWNKSVIVRNLEAEAGLSRKMARAVAGEVEGKVLRIGCHRVTCGLVREVVKNELLAMRQAETALVEESERELQAVPVAG